MAVTTGISMAVTTGTVAVAMPSAGMTLCCMGIVRCVVGMPGISDRVNHQAVAAGMRCRVGSLAGMAAVVRGVVPLRIRTRMIICVMVIFGPQRSGNDGQCGKRSQGGSKFGGGEMCFHTVCQTREAEGNSNDFDESQQAAPFTEGSWRGPLQRITINLPNLNVAHLATRIRNPARGSQSSGAHASRRAH